MKSGVNSNGVQWLILKGKVHCSYYISDGIYKEKVFPIMSKKEIENLSLKDMI